jgi:hypothetical protein
MARASGGSLLHCVNALTARLPGLWSARVQPAEDFMARQLLHLVFGGELVDPQSTEFRDVSAIDIVGIFPNYGEAYKAWKGKAQATVDNAHMRYFIAHLHRLTDEAEPAGATEKLG